MSGGLALTTDSLREHTYLPDKTFPINVFHVKGIGLHWHPHMEWIYVKHGSARVQIDGLFAHLSAGEMALVNAKQLHAATVLEDRTELWAIVFNEALLRNSGLDSTEANYFSPIFSHQLSLPNFLHSDTESTAEIRASVARLVSEFESRQPGFELLIKAELFRSFGLIFRYHQQLAIKSSPKPPKDEFTALLEYLRDHFQEEVTVSEAAKRVNLSPNHFCKIFKRLTGKTFIEYINLLRVNQAERLLMDTDLPITLVADKVGFGNLSYFNRVFKSYKQMPPSRFRLQGVRF